jgi:hypothetical protein
MVLRWLPRPPSAAKVWQKSQYCILPFALTFPSALAFPFLILAALLARRLLAAVLPDPCVDSSAERDGSTYFIAFAYASDALA